MQNTRDLPSTKKIKSKQLSASRYARKGRRTWKSNRRNAVRRALKQLRRKSKSKANPVAQASQHVPRQRKGKLSLKMKHLMQELNQAPIQSRLAHPTIRTNRLAQPAVQISRVMPVCVQNVPCVLMKRLVKTKSTRRHQRCTGLRRCQLLDKNTKQTTSLTKTDWLQIRPLIRLL